MSIDTIIAIDWSARSKPSAKTPVKDAIYLCAQRLGSPAAHPQYFRTRHAVMQHLYELLEIEMTAGRKIFVGFDFSFGYPQGFAQALTGKPEALAIWDWLKERIEDGPDNSNNRFEVACEINKIFAGLGPFWGAPAHLKLPGLPHKGAARHSHGLPEYRQTDLAAKAQSSWKLYTTGAVGSQSLLGLPYLAGLRNWLGKRCQVWPIEGSKLLQRASVVLAEIYPSILTAIEIAADYIKHWPDQLYQILDAQQVRGSCDELQCMFQTDPVFQSFIPADIPANIRIEEGWIMGSSFVRGRQ